MALEWIYIPGPQQMQMNCRNNESLNLNITSKKCCICVLLLVILIFIRMNTAYGACRGVGGKCGGIIIIALHAKLTMFLD